MSKKPRTITPADESAHRNLRRIWDAKRKQLDLTQERVANDLGRSQGLIGQYLNGHIALGPVATLTFARLLQVSPKEIRPDFSYGEMIPGEIPPDVVEMAIKLASLPANVRRDALGFLNLTIAHESYHNFVDRMAQDESSRAPTDSVASNI